MAQDIWTVGFYFNPETRAQIVRKIRAAGLTQGAVIACILEHNLDQLPQVFELLKREKKIRSYRKAAKAARKTPKTLSRTPLGDPADEPKKHLRLVPERSNEEDVPAPATAEKLPATAENPPVDGSRKTSRDGGAAAKGKETIGDGRKATKATAELLEMAESTTTASKPLAMVEKPPEEMAEKAVPAVKKPLAMVEELPETVSKPLEMEEKTSETAETLRGRLHKERAVLAKVVKALSYPGDYLAQDVQLALVNYIRSLNRPANTPAIQKARDERNKIFQAWKAERVEVSRELVELTLRAASLKGREKRMVSMSQRTKASELAEFDRLRRLDERPLLKLWLLQA